MEIHDPLWSYGKSKLLYSIKESGIVIFWSYGVSVIFHWGSSPGKITPWLVASVLAGMPEAESAKTIPPSIVSVAKDAGEPNIEKVNRPLVPTIEKIKGPF
jgi:hypothetical protein